MHIALLIYGTLQNQSGGYLYDRQLVRHLRAAGDEVTVISIPWRSYPRHLLDNWDRGLARRLARLPVDLLLQDELNHPSLFRLNGWLRPRVAYPLVSIVHHLRCQEAHPRGLLPLYRWVERRYLDSVDGAIFNSPNTRQSVADLLGRDLPGVVSLPAADHLPIPKPGEVAAKLARPRDGSQPLRLLSVGSVIPRKGIHHLLDGLARLPGEAWRLTVAGGLDVDPAYVARLRGQVTALGLGERVTLAGHLSPADLTRAYAEADVMALLSFEGFGIALLEALGFGLPVLAANFGAAPDLIRDGETGFLVPPQSPEAVAGAIGRWLKEPPLVARMGRDARARYDQHPTWADGGAISRAFLEASAGQQRGVHPGQRPSSR